jgi:hypothetical protein
MRKYLLGLLVVLSIVAIGAAKCSCNVGGGIDSKKVEKLITDSFNGVVSATCPESIDNTPGTAFECTGKNAAGGLYTISGTVKEDNNVNVVVKSIP